MEGELMLQLPSWSLQTLYLNNAFVTMATDQNANSFLKKVNRGVKMSL